MAAECRRASSYLLEQDNGQPPTDLSFKMSAPAFAATAQRAGADARMGRLADWQVPVLDGLLLLESGYNGHFVRAMAMHTLV